MRFDFSTFEQLDSYLVKIVQNIDVKASRRIVSWLELVSEKQASFQSRSPQIIFSSIIFMVFGCLQRHGREVQFEKLLMCRVFLMRLCSSHPLYERSERNKHYVLMRNRYNLKLKKKMFNCCGSFGRTGWRLAGRFSTWTEFRPLS